MAHEFGTGDDLLRESRVAERALIDAENRAERTLAIAETRFRRSMEKLARAQQKAELRRRGFEHARAQLDQCQLERAAGPMLRPRAVERPSLPRPARDDSRARERKRTGPAPEDAGPEKEDLT